MRPKIMTAKSIAKSLSYNEEKISQGKAECIAAANFLKTPEHLTIEDKLYTFQRRMELNDHVRTSQHITLNFHPSNELTNEQMKQIAARYMKEIGFALQPYVVYRHHDSGHPHCHIVTTHIQRDGNPIDLYNIGRNQSEKARLLIIDKYQLKTTAQPQKVLLPDQIPSKIFYGKTALAPAIAKVLTYVMEKFHCISFEEFNFVLRLFNLEAYRGKEGTILAQNHGILYRVLDNTTKQYIGVPIKASFFDFKPTLQNLEKTFVKNISLKQHYKEVVISRITWNLKGFMSFERFQQYCLEDKITVASEKQQSGALTKVTYIDWQYGCVWKEKELDHECSAQNIQSHIEQHARRLSRRHSLHI